VETCAAGEGRVPNRRDKPVQRAPPGPSRGSPLGPSRGSNSDTEQGIAAKAEQGITVGPEQGIAAGANRGPVLCGTTGRGSPPPIGDRLDSVTMRSGTQL
jgi:hypothetical protein